MMYPLVMLTIFSLVPGPHVAAVLSFLPQLQNVEQQTTAALLLPLLVQYHLYLLHCVFYCIGTKNNSEACTAPLVAAIGRGDSVFIRVLRCMRYLNSLQRLETLAVQGLYEEVRHVHLDDVITLGNAIRPPHFAL